MLRSCSSLSGGVPYYLSAMGGAGEVDHLLEHIVQKPGLLGIAGLVVDLFAFPSADDQPGGSKLLQMVGYGRAAHFHQGGQIDHTFLTMAQQPKDSDPGGISQLLE